MSIRLSTSSRSLSLLVLYMRSDLLDAAASVQWAVSNFPSLQVKLGTWIDENVRLAVREGDANSPDNQVVIVKRAPFPLRFNAEFGAYVNAIRSALDMVAVALARRSGVTALNKAYFPVAKSEVEFNSGGGKWKDLKNIITATEARVIESLRPYAGGNDLLWQLHQLDITRKHHRLLSVSTEHSAIWFGPSGVPHGSVDFRTGHIPETETETVYALMRKGIPHDKMQATFDVFINEPALDLRRPVIVTLNKFASFANHVIGLFDR